MSKLVPTTEAAFEPDRLAAQLLEHGLNHDVPLAGWQDDSLAEIARDYFEHAPVAMHWVGGDGIILWANRAELDLLGCRAEDYIGRHIAEFHADAPVIEDILARLTCGETLHKYPARLRAKDGAIRHVLISSSGHFRNGKLVNTRCITIDMTAQRDADAALRENERHLRTLLNGLPAAVYTTDAQGRITYYNEAAAALWGHRPELGKNEWCGSWKLFWPDGTPLPHEECPMAVALKEQVAVRGLEAAAERPDGTRVPFMPYPTPLFDSAGALTGAINMLVDLTGRKQAEAALRASEARLSAELEATQHLQAVSTELVREQDVTVLYDKLVEAAALIMRSDYASLQMLYPERGSGGELRLLAFRGFNPQAAKFWEWVRADSESTCGAALRTGRRVIASDVALCDFMAGTQDLETYLQTGIHAVQTTPLISRSGRLLGMISTHWREPHNPSEGDLRRLDILARQAADLIERAQADEGRQRLAAIVESSDDAILSKDLNGIIMSCNPGAERLFGYSAAELIGKPVTVLMSPEYRHEEPGILERIRRGEGIDHYETVRQRKDGSLIDISLTVSPLKDEKGKIVGASKIARDITARKRADEQRALLLREMNHRIKNLFAVAGGMLTLSARSARTPEDFANTVRGRLDALARAHELVVPGLSDTGLPEQSSTLDVVLQTILSPYTNGNGRDCVVAAGPAVRIGPNAAASFALVLHELATNAAKYGALSRPQGRVHVGWSAENGELSLTWTEHDGPPVKEPPADEGFGSRLTGRSAGQLGGRLTRDWRPEGLIVRLSVPIDRLAA